MIDKDFELQGEAAERPKRKKLTMGHIPGGYSYAAVNANGRAYAFDDEPEPRNNGTWDFKYCNGKKLFIGKFDSTDWENSVVPNETDLTDWENSVVSCETAERPQPKKLTAADIPEGYGWAAVDKNGYAYAFTEKPTALRCVWVVNEFVEQNAFFIGQDFDTSDWRNSLVIRETAERPQPKKLTAADIPEGYNYAAVNLNGSGYAFKTRPLLSGLLWGGDCQIDGYEFLGGFDSSDWKNSLVCRETAERPEPEALKDQENKPSFLEIDPNFLEAMAWRMTSNKGKYPPNNWQRSHDLLLDVDAIYRHLNDIKRQLEGSKSLTGESIQKHCAAIACNAMFLFYHTQEDQWQRAARSRQSNAKEI